MQLYFIMQTLAEFSCQNIMDQNINIQYTYISRQQTATHGTIRESKYVCIEKTVNCGDGGCLGSAVFSRPPSEQLVGPSISKLAVERYSWPAAEGSGCLTSFSEAGRRSRRTQSGRRQQRWYRNQHNQIMEDKGMIIWWRKKRKSLG